MRASLLQVFVKEGKKGGNEGVICFLRKHLMEGGFADSCECSHTKGVSYRFGNVSSAWHLAN